MTTELGFYHFTKAGHDPELLPERILDEMTFAVYKKDSYSISGEFCIRWYDMGTQGIAPKLEAFSDSWEALSKFPKLLKYLAKNNENHISPEDVTEFLLKSGVVDKTFFTH